jgi:hypothetical protein
MMDEPLVMSDLTNYAEYLLREGFLDDELDARRAAELLLEDANNVNRPRRRPRRINVSGTR